MKGATQSDSVTAFLETKSSSLCSQEDGNNNAPSERLNFTQLWKCDKVTHQVTAAVNMLMSAEEKK